MAARKLLQRSEIQHQTIIDCLKNEGIKIENAIKKVEKEFVKDIVVGIPAALEALFDIGIRLERKDTFKTTVEKESFGAALAILKYHEGFIDEGMLVTILKHAAGTVATDAVAQAKKQSALELANLADKAIKNQKGFNASFFPHTYVESIAPDEPAFKNLIGVPMLTWFIQHKYDLGATKPSTTGVPGKTVLDLVAEKALSPKQEFSDELLAPLEYLADQNVGSGDAGWLFIYAKTHLNYLGTQKDKRVVIMTSDEEAKIASMAARTQRLLAKLEPSLK